eukprot:COSAG02_NODE_48128_length_336_cov_0.649789_1_plen_28_part_10
MVYVGPESRRTRTTSGYICEASGRLYAN